MTRGRRRLGMALWSLCAVNHPEKGRQFVKVPPEQTRMVFDEVWVPVDSHPLGGCIGYVTLYRRVNLKKDELPRWIQRRPFYEFTKENTS